MTEQRIRFLSLDNVVAIHNDTIIEEGGDQGIREMGLLESAVAMPQAMLYGKYLHAGVAEMAAAYLFHICQGHAFIDGNKRTAALSALLFLDLNGVAEEQMPTEADIERVTLSVAMGTMTKGDLMQWLRKLLN